MDFRVKAHFLGTVLVVTNLFEVFALLELHHVPVIVNFGLDVIRCHIELWH